MTAAMPDGTGIASLWKEISRPIYDVGICRAACCWFGQWAVCRAKPVVAIYSTFLQRAYDQVFHDLCLERNGVVFAPLDRAGIVGNDGPYA